jgi:hypothetical protein
MLIFDDGANVSGCQMQVNRRVSRGGAIARPIIVAVPVCRPAGCAMGAGSLSLNLYLAVYDLLASPVSANRP